MKTSFAQEFRVDKALKMQIDQRFRDNRQVIERLLNKESQDTHEFADLFREIGRTYAGIEEFLEEVIGKKTESELNRYLSDMIHMTVNRIISDNQRTHELVMYDFLYRYYHAEVAKAKRPNYDD